MSAKYTIKRHIEKIVIETSKEYKVIVISGQRQIGKSTLLSYLFRKHKHVELNSKGIIQYANDDPSSFFQRYSPPIFIDEIQKAPVLFSYIKDMVDHSDRNGQFIVTGSQPLELMKGVSDTLSTRAASIKMVPLSISEINGSKNFIFEPNFQSFLERKQKSKTQIQIFNDIIKGSMPDIINGQKKNTNIFYESYIKNSLFKDIKEDWVQIKDYEKFLKFFRVLASQVGEEVSDRSIAELSRLDHKTVSNWINALASIGVIFFLYPYSHSTLKRTTHFPKLYFYDTGLSCHLTGYTDSQTLLESQYAGHIFECYVISEICKGYINNGERPSIYYIRDANNKEKEIDLIIEGKNGRIFPIEIKKSVTPLQKHFKNFPILKNIKDIRIMPMTLICQATEAQTFGIDKLVLPVHWL